LTHKMTTSIRLPKVIFMSAPTVSPISLAMVSVAYVNNPDNGMIAIALDVKTIEGFALDRYVAIPIGTKMSRRFPQLENAIARTVNTIDMRDPDLATLFFTEVFLLV
jgi:hypothetical protein